MITRALPRRNQYIARAAALLAVAAAAVLGFPSPASAAQRYAAHNSIATGSCTVISPCRLDHAVGGAAAGDEVVVLPGSYAVNVPIAATVPLDVHGVVGQPRPRLLGSSSLPLGSEVFELGAGGSLRHLAVETTAPGSYAVELIGGVGSGLELRGASGGGAQLTGVSGGTVLRDSVARTDGDNAVQAKDGASAGPVKILNVTAIATGVGASAVKGKQRSATTIVRNTIARGDGEDIGTNSRALIAVDHSNFRAASSSGYTDAGANQSGEPLFADLAGGNLRALAGSTTIDAGVADVDLGAHDAAGRARSVGVAPDLGAYEFDPEDPDAGIGSEPVLAPPAPPVMGSTVTVSPATGTVRVRPPGSSVSVELTAGASVPVNSIVDTRKGAIRLTSVRDADGTRQTGTFSGGVFQIRQRVARNPYTDLVLQGGNFRRCTRRTAASGAAVVQALRRAPYVRRLWARDRGGRFRTRGRFGHAVVRGTKWLTVDRCDGTLFVVKRGAIDVRRNRGRGRAVRVRAGGRYLLRAR